MIKVAQRLAQVQEYYFSSKLKQVSQMVSDGKPILNMGIGSPDLAPHPSVIQAMHQAILDDKAHEYQSYQGLPELRQAMSDFYQRHFKVSLDSNHEVLPLMGSKEGIMHISMAFLNPRDRVLVPNPGYPTYAAVAQLVQAEVVYYDLNQESNWLPDLEQLEQSDLKNVKLMWVSYPHMPTGAKATVPFLQKLIDFGIKHQIIIVNDNPYSFVLNDSPISIFNAKGAKSIAMELNSLSKTFNVAGWRVGMVLGNTSMIEAVLKVKSNMDSGMFYGIQKGAIAALQLSDDWFNVQKQIYSDRRALMYRLVKLLGCSFETESSGMFVWAKLPNYEKAEEFTDKLLEHKNIFVTPGTVFGTGGEGYIRFSLCIPEEKIKEAIKRFE